MFDSSAIKSAASFTARYCPHDQINRWEQSVQLRCGQTPQQHQIPGPVPCCTTFKWTTLAGDTVWMRKTGKFNDGKEVYEGDDNGITKTLYWTFDSVNPRFGAWFVSDFGVNGTGQQSANIPVQDAMNSCPNDNSLSFLTLTCVNHHVPKIQTCSDVTNTKTLLPITMTSGDTSYTECKIQSVLQEVAAGNVDWVLRDLLDMADDGFMDKALAVDLEWRARAGWPKIFNAWMDMTREQGSIDDPQSPRCGFMHDIDNSGMFGTVPDCNDLCGAVKKIDHLGSPLDIKPIMDQILTLFLNEFDNGTCII